jgi:hypothetical protein
MGSSQSRREEETTPLSRTLAQQSTKLVRTNVKLFDSKLNIAMENGWKWIIFRYRGEILKDVYDHFSVRGFCVYKLDDVHADGFDTRIECFNDHVTDEEILQKAILLSRIPRKHPPKFDSVYFRTISIKTQMEEINKRLKVMFDNGATSIRIGHNDDGTPKRFCPSVVTAFRNEGFEVTDDAIRMLKVVPRTPRLPPQPPPSQQGQEQEAGDDNASESGSSLLMCVVCYERQRVCVLKPCHHLCLCQECGRTVTKCPICRANVRERIRIFMS